MTNFTLSHLDHVAIHVADPDAAVTWYQQALGLRKMKLKEWGEFPIFMLAGQVGFTSRYNACQPRISIQKQAP